MNHSNYQARRTQLLYEVGLHQCLHCGHPGSRSNPLEFHHSYQCGRHGIGGRQNLVALEQDWWEWTHFHTHENEIMVLCHDCHMKVHNEKAQKQEAEEDEALIKELTRYRFCANQSIQCIHKRCLECPDYRVNLEPACMDIKK